MSTLEIKKEIVNYIEHADKKTLEALYTLLKPSMHSKTFEITDEEIEEMEQNRKDYLNGRAKGYTLEEARKKITSKA